MAKRKIKKVLIIGSNSFSAGSMISLLLRKNYKVFAISRSQINNEKFLRFDKYHKNFRFLRLCLNKDQKKILKLIMKISPSYILNYASQSMVGQSWNNAKDWFYTNSYSMVKFYDQLGKLKKKFRLIHVSTPEVYGNVNSFVKENKIYNPTTPYAVSRVTSDQFLEIINLHSNLDFCIIRASNVYGEYQRLYRLIPKTIFCILKNKKLNLEGGGTSKRNFIHIDDVSSATYKIMLKGKSSEIYHICGDTMNSIRSVVKQICLIMKYDFKKLIKNSPDRVGKDKNYKLINKKIKNDLNWHERITLEQGIVRTINWIAKYLDKFQLSDEKYYHKK